MINALTVDVEDWYHTNGLNISRDHWDYLPSLVYPNTMKLLNLFEEYDVKATFFILGDVAKRHPSLIQEIIKRGHEIGSHGMNHQLVYSQTVEEFKTDFLESVRLLESLSQQKIRYYRAPSWSFSKDRLELLSFLEQNGIICDSSLQPFKTPLSGIQGIPTHPFKPIISGRKLELIEFPSTVMKLGGIFTFPFAGGFYLRLLPASISAYCLRKINHSKTGMVYIHPWELNPEIPKWRTNWFIRMIQYYRLHSVERKLRRLLKEFKFAPLGEVIKSQKIVYKKI